MRNTVRSCLAVERVRAGTFVAHLPVSIRRTARPALFQACASGHGAGATIPRTSRGRMVPRACWAMSWADCKARHLYIERRGGKGREIKRKTKTKHVGKQKRESLVWKARPG